MRTADERAILVHVSLNQQNYHVDDRHEFVELVRASGTTVLAQIDALNIVPRAKLLLGQGKADEIKQVVVATCASIVLVNHPLSPSQESELSRLFGVRVLDRTSLILDIFAQRARTFEGKLQVELAQLTHLSTRLVRGWTHLERQKGGIGLRGPGETQLETDRRLIRQRMSAIQQQLSKVQSNREQNRRARLRTRWPLVSLVGYTNAGKSTLFNTLTQSDVYAADKLFATLDPTLRRVALPGGNSIILADTVGFIRALPHDLVEAFRATLEEVRESQLLLHVVDSQRNDRYDTINDVQQVLKDMGASHIPQMMVFNKVDKAPERWLHGRVQSTLPKVWVSAKEGMGLSAMQQLIVEQLFGRLGHYTIKAPMSCGRMRARLYEKHIICHEQVTEEGQWQWIVQMTAAAHQTLLSELA